MQNPGVQDCGSPLAYVVANRPDVRINPIAPDAPPDAARLAVQETCRPRVLTLLEQAMIAFAAFAVLGLLGAALGLLDDRLAYRRAPRFETLLRERPADAPGRLRPPPAILAGELAGSLPPVEGPDVAILAGFGLVPLAVLVWWAGPADVRELLGQFAVVGTVGLVICAGAAQAVASLQLAVSVGASRAPSDVAAADGSTTDGDVAGSGRARSTRARSTRAEAAGAPGLAAPGRLVLVSLTGSFLGRLLPGLGPLGLDAHWRARLPGDGGRAVPDLQVRQVAGVAVHAVVLVLVAVLARPVLGPSGDGWPTATSALAAAVGLLLLVGLVRGPGRFRRLPVRPSVDAGRRVLALMAAEPGRGLAVVGSALALLAVDVVALLVAASAAGTGAGVALVAFTALVAGVVVAVAPTPGGVAAVEPVTVLVLVAAGVEPAAAVVAVIMWRAATFWLPFAVGGPASHRLRSAGDI